MSCTASMTRRWLPRPVANVLLRPSTSMVIAPASPSADGARCRAFRGDFFSDAGQAGGDRGAGNAGRGPRHHRFPAAEGTAVRRTTRARGYAVGELTFSPISAPVKVPSERPL